MFSNILEIFKKKKQSETPNFGVYFQIFLFDGYDRTSEILMYDQTSFIKMDVYGVFLVYDFKLFFKQNEKKLTILFKEMQPGYIKTLIQKLGKINFYTYYQVEMAWFTEVTLDMLHVITEEENPYFAGYVAIEVDFVNASHKKIREVRMPVAYDPNGDIPDNDIQIVTEVVTPEKLLESKK